MRRVKIDAAASALLRMGDILSAKPAMIPRYGKQYSNLLHDNLFARMRACIAKAGENGSWDFMNGCFSQAVEIYAVAALAYEQFDAPIMTDGLFDRLAAFLLANYDRITDYTKETWRLSPEIFKAGTGSTFSNWQSYPSLVPYYNRLQAIKESTVVRPRNKPRLLRQATVGGKPKRKVPLRRPV